MKIFRKLCFVLTFTLIFAVSAIAQTEKAQSATPTKIAVVNTDAFEDKEKGIKELVEAYAKLDEEFKSYVQELKALFEKIQGLQKDISRREYSDFTRESAEKFKEELLEKIQKHKLLTAEYKSRETEARNLYAKRESEVVNPIKLKIGEALKQFAKEKGYEMVLDRSKLPSWTDVCLGCFDNSIDLTVEFINYYNSLPAKQQ